jgi:hypothetical protein
MESTDTMVIAEKRNDASVFIRRLFSSATIVAAAMAFIGFVMLLSSKALGLQPASRSLFYACMYFGAIGFFAAAAAHFLLDIMYGVFGLLHVNIFRLIGWFLLIIISLLSLTGIFAATRLAGGLQS